MAGISLVGRPHGSKMASKGPGPNRPSYTPNTGTSRGVGGGKGKSYVGGKQK